MRVATLLKQRGTAADNAETMAVSETDQAYLAISELLAKLPMEAGVDEPLTMVNNHININKLDSDTITTGIGNSVSNYYNSSFVPSSLPGRIRLRRHYC